MDLLGNTKPGRSSANRSLERGISILRAFRPGSTLLGNGELAEKTGLSRSTVTRLTQTLVGCGALEMDARTRLYRLGPLMLSLGCAMRGGSSVVTKGVPLMQRTAQKLRVNVGMAVADRDEMVYLESLRAHRNISPRNVVAGQRVPIELTSLGRAYLAMISAEQREALYAVFARRYPRKWPSLRAQIERSIASVHARSYCVVSWQPAVLAISTPLQLEGLPVHVLNVSLTDSHPLAVSPDELAQHLLALAQDISHAVMLA